MTCIVDGTTNYSATMSVLDTAASEPAEALRFIPRADAQVATPSLGVAVYYSSTQGALSSKNSAGSVAILDIGNPTIINFTDPGSDPSNVAGRLYWRSSNLNLCMGGEVIRQLGEELQLPATRNNTGSSIADGTAVYISGALGSQPTIAKASRDSVTANSTIAVATETIANNETGYATTFGAVRNQVTNVDSDGTDVNDGDEMFLGDNGGWVVTKPYGTDETVSLGNILYAHSSEGVKLVNVRRVPSRGVHFGMCEARPVTASSSYSNLHVWSWTDCYFPVSTGDKLQNQFTTEVYRDTPQLKSFARHDRDTEIHIDYQMPHPWCGTAVELHAHLIPMGGVTGNAYFSGQYFFGGIGAETPANSGWTQFTKAVELTAANQYKKIYSDIVTCAAPASPNYSDILSIFVQREGTNGSDTYTASKDHETPQANVCIESVDIHYQRYIVGSEEEYSGDLTYNPSCIMFDQNYYKGDVYLRAAVKSDGGNSCTFRLYDVTGDAAISGSTITTTSTTYEVQEVGPLTLGAGMRQYRMQAKYDSAADEPKLVCAQMILR